MTNNTRAEAVLVFINKLGNNFKSEQTYEFIFAASEDIEYGNGWDEEPAAMCEDLTPPPYSEIVRVAKLITSNLDLEVIQESEHFCVTDSVEKIVALGWDVVPPNVINKRLVFHYGETFESVKSKLYSRDYNLKIEEIEHNNVGINEDIV